MGLKLIIAKDANAVGKKVASEIINLLKVKKDAVLGLATGGTAEAVYPHLIKAYQKKEIDFKNVKSVNLDEYKGLDSKNEQSYRYFMNKNLFDHVNIDKKNTLFSKMKLSLREFENAENPISLIAEYYKSRGKEAWWLPSDSDDSQQKMISPFEITLFCDLSKEKKKELISYGLAHFPEILCTSRKGSKMRYTRFVKWLFLRQSVICPNVRDLFSAGG